MKLRVWERTSATRKFFDMTDGPPHRWHNREEDSPEALRQSIGELAEAIAQLDRRLDEATLRLDSEVEGARNITRRLATEVGLMGRALVRRIEATPSSLPSTKRRWSGTWPLALALTIGLALAIVGFAVLGR